MTQYLRHNTSYTFAPDVSGVALDKLPAGFYRVCWNDIAGFYLEIAEPLTLIAKAYGNAYQHQDRIMNTFNERVGLPTTVLLEGYKGTGKTLLAKKLCVDFVNAGGICLLQGKAYTGDAYKAFLQKIEQQKIVFIDEFDKVYNESDKVNDMLTLLDGMYPMHTLFILTMNADSRGSRYEYFSNRPGRVYYNIHFGSISESTIREYAADNLINKSRIDEIIEYVGRFSMFNMDMLTVLVKEVNNNENISVRELGVFLNIKPTISYDDVRLDITATYKGYDVSNSLNRDYLSADYFERMVTTNDFRFLLQVYPNTTRKTDDGEVKLNHYDEPVRVIGYMDEESGKFVELPKYERRVTPCEVECSFDPKERVMTIHDKENDLIIKACAKPRFSYLNRDSRTVVF